MDCFPQIPPGSLFAATIPFSIRFSIFLQSHTFRSGIRARYRRILLLIYACISHRDRKQTRQAVTRDDKRASRLDKLSRCPKTTLSHGRKQVIRNYRTMTPDICTGNTGFVLSSRNRGEMNRCCLQNARVPMTTGLKGP